MPRIDALSQAHEALGKFATLHRLLADQGLSDTALQWPINDESFRRDLAWFWSTHGYQESDLEKKCRGRFAGNYFSVLDAIRLFPAYRTGHYPDIPTDIPVDISTVIGLPDVAIAEMRRTYRQYFLSDESTWHKEPWAEKPGGSFTWRMIRLENGRFLEPVDPYLAIYLGVASSVRGHGPRASGRLTCGYSLEWTKGRDPKMFLVKKRK
jgi:hypothetical protein